MRSLLAGLVVAIGLALPASALAAADWLAPTPALTQTSGAGSPDAVMDANGTVVAVWFRPGAVEAAVREPGGSFGAPVQVSGADSQPSTAPALALGQDGNAYVAWPGASGKVHVARRAPGGSFESLGAVDAPMAVGVDVAADPAGRVHVSFAQSEMVPPSPLMTTSVRMATRPPGGTFGAPVILDSATPTGLGGIGTPDGPSVGAPQLGLGPGGKPLLAWVKSTSSTTTLTPTCTIGVDPGCVAIPGTMQNVTSSNLVVAAVDAAGAPEGQHIVSSAVRMITGLAISGSPAIVLGDLATNAAGAAVLPWYETTGSASRSKVALRPAGATSFAAVKDLGDVAGAAPLSIPAAAVDPAGRAVAAYESGTQIRAAAASADGTWGDSAQIGAVGIGIGFSPAPDVASAPDGSFIASWFDGPNQAIETAVRPAGGSFGPSEAAATVADSGIPAVFPLPAAHPFAGPDGNGGVVYLNGPIVGQNVHVAGYDASGPKISNLQAPDGTAGTAVPFSAQAIDVWSTVQSLAWDFGDGGGGTGPSVEHVFTTPGSFVARLTATDSLGNSSTAERNVAIAGTQSTTPADTTAPELQGKVTTSNSKFTVGTASTPVTLRPAAKKKTTPKGTVFTYSLSEAATVTVTITRGVAGLKDGGVCKPATKKLAKDLLKKLGAKKFKKAKCTAQQEAGKLTRAGVAGKNTLPFSGRIGKKALKPGSYAASFAAQDAAGNRSAVKSVKFTVVPAPKTKKR